MIQNLRWLLGFFGDYRKWFFVGLGLALLDAVLQTSVPLIFREILNGIQEDPDWIRGDHLWILIGLGVVLSIGFFFAAYFYHVLVQIAAARFCRNLQVALYNHVQRLSADFFQRRQVGEITQRVNGDLDVIHGTLGTLSGMLWGFFLLTTTVIIMVWVNVQLFLIFVVLKVVVLIASHYTLPRIRKLNREVRDALGDVSAQLTEYLSVIDLIKSYSHERRANQRIENISDEVRLKRERLYRTQFLYVDLMQVLVRFVAPMVLLFVGAWWISADRLLVGDLVLFWGFWLMVGGIITMLVSNFSQIFTALAAVDRVREFFHEVPTIKDGENASSCSDTRGEITFQNLSFRYPSRAGGPVIEDLNLTIPAGQQVAFVGPSGAGKSTILQLLLRFYDPDQGGILLDGRDLRDLQLESLRSNIGFVMQESVFLSGSVSENLRLAKEDATTEEMIEALKSANAWEFVQQLDRGLDTLIGERGARLSGGQRQRLSLARVFLKNPPVILLDEATSALDTVSERLVQEALNRLLQGRTSLVIAHRISTVIHSPRILVLERGHLVGDGTHQQLLESCSLYEELCRHQGLGKNNKSASD